MGSPAGALVIGSRLRAIYIVLIVAIIRIAIALLVILRTRIVLIRITRIIVCLKHTSSNNHFSS